MSSTRRSSLRLYPRAVAALAAALALGLFAPVASAQWAGFVNDTTNRMRTTSDAPPGVNTPALSTTDPEEKDYAWADLDKDGDIDLVCVRKVPFTFAGGRRNVLFMNESGVLNDRTTTLANMSINVPATGPTPGNEIAAANAMSPPIPGWLGSSQGFLDPTNDRDVVIGDVNNDTWPDVVTATTISDVNNAGAPYYLPRFLGHPRVYINKGEIGGVWQGLEYDYNRFPQLVSKTGTPWHPRFCSLAIGDVTGDGFADLYFGDYDSAEVGPDEPAGTDMDNKLLINNGAGVFVDQSVMRMGTVINYAANPPPNINGNYLLAAFGAASVIADMNGDGRNDVVKQSGLEPATQHVAVVYNNAARAAPGTFDRYQFVTRASPYFVSAGDLNNDGRLDLVVTDDGIDHYHLNQGNAGDGTAIFGNANFVNDTSGFGGQSAIVDLDNDGFRDVVIADVDVDGFGCARRMHIFHNLGNIPNVTLQEETAPAPVIPLSMLEGTHNVAPFDINNDGWVDLVIGRCSSTEVWMNTGTRVTVASPPTFVTPSTGTVFPVTISTSEAAPVVAGSARLYYSINGAAFTFTALSPQGGSLYHATLPSGACGDDIRYYISVQTSTGGPPLTFTQPAGAPANFFTAIRGTALTPTINEEFEGSVASWSVVNDNGLTLGFWQAADPNVTLVGGIQASPEDDATPAPGVKAFVTENGLPGGAASTADVDGGPTNLLSPTLDATVGGSVYRVSYAYWFFASDATTNSLTVSVSNNNGGSWTTVKTYSASSGGWKRDSFLISAFVAPTNQIRVRFSALDGGAVSTVEAGIDDFRLEKVSCAPPCVADVNGDTTVNINDLLGVIIGWGLCAGCPPTHCPADVAPPPGGDCSVNINDLLLVIINWGACPS